MTNTEIKDALARLSVNRAQFEAALEENGGEITPEVEGLLQEQEDIKALITSEGIDSLGEWLHSVEDEIARAKDRKAKVDAEIRRKGSLVEYIKHAINYAMQACEVEKAKGDYYSFARYTSVKNTANKDAIAEKYGDVARKALSDAGVPDYITLSLGVSVKDAPADLLLTTSTDTVKFSKPRKTKETEE